MSTQTKALATTDQNNSVIARMAARFQMDRIAFERTIKATCFQNGGKDVTNEQFAAFCLIADQYDLNPLTKEIHAFTKGGGIVPIVGVDGWVRLVNRQPDFNGYQQRVVHDDELGLGIETTMYRKEWAHPAVQTEWLVECKRPTEPWKMEMRMLGHKSYMQTARKAYGFGGIYDEDEAERIIEVQATQRVVERSAESLAELTDKLQQENSGAATTEPDPELDVFDMKQPLPEAKK